MKIFYTITFFIVLLICFGTSVVIYFFTNEPGKILLKKEKKKKLFISLFNPFNNEILELYIVKKIINGIAILII